MSGQISSQWSGNAVMFRPKSKLPVTRWISGTGWVNSGRLSVKHATALASQCTFRKQSSLFKGLFYLYIFFLSILSFSKQYIIMSTTAPWVYHRWSSCLEYHLNVAWRIRLPAYLWDGGFPEVSPEDGDSWRLVRQRDVDQLVQTPWTQDGGVYDVWPVGNEGGEGKYSTSHIISLVRLLDF